MPELLERDSFLGLRVGADERLARASCAARSVASSASWPALRRVLSAGSRSTAGSAPSRPSRGCSTSASWSGCATSWRDAGRRGAVDARRAGPRMETRQPRAAAQDAGRARGVQVGEGLRADVGEPGCGRWHSRPRLGLIGMLMGWWRVKVSSGCPLAGRLAAVEQEAQGKATERAAPAEKAAVAASKPAPGSPHPTSARRLPGVPFRWRS